MIQNRHKFYIILAKKVAHTVPILLSFLQILQITLLVADYMNMMGHTQHRRNLPSGTRSKASHGLATVNSGTGIQSGGPPSTPRSMGAHSRASSRGTNIHPSTNHNINAR